MDDSLGQLIHDHLLICLWRSNLKPLQLKKFLHKQGKLYFLELTLKKGVDLKDATLDLVFSNLYRSTFCHRLKAIFESFRVFFTESCVSTFIVFNNIAKLYCIVNLYCVLL